MNKQKQGGLIKMIILFIIAIAVLSWYGVDIKNFFSSDLTRRNFGYVWNLIRDIWIDYLQVPAIKLWNIWVEYIWQPFLSMLQKSKEVTN